MKNVFTYSITLLLFYSLSTTSFAQFTTVDAAVFNVQNGCYQLTPAVNSQRGAIWNNTTIDLSRCFVAEFDVDMGDISGAINNSADGIAFVLQRQGIAAIGSGGGSIGYNGIMPSIAVAMRTWVYDQVDIWADGMGIGNSPVCCDISGMSFPITGGGLNSVTVAWDVTTQTLSVDWGNDGIDIAYVSDIVADHFGGDPTNIIWGFTAATGGANAAHVVCVENFTSFDCIEIVPTLGQWAIIILALMILIIGVVQLNQEKTEIIVERI